MNFWTYRKTLRLLGVAVPTAILTGFSGFRVSHVRPGWWYPQAFLKAPNPDAVDQAAYALALSGDTVAMGASLEDSNQTSITNGTTASADNSASDAGAVYVYKRTGSNWSQEAYIKAVNANAGDWFGATIALSGDTLVVGANSESSNLKTITNGATASADNSAYTTGAVYVYKRTGTSWAQEAYIKASNADPGDYFGTKVALDGDTLAVSAPLESSSQVTITNGTTASADNSLTKSGAVYIYKRTGTAWVQEAYIKAPNAGANDEFGGTALALSGDTLVVGVQKEDSNQSTITNGTTASADDSFAESGAVYVFKRSGSTWAQEAYIKAPNVGANDTFGFSVDINADTLVVGAHQEDSNQNTITNGSTASSNNSSESSGAVYIFKRTGSSWAQEAYLKPSNTTAYAMFGYSVAVSGDTVLACAPGESSNQRKVWNDPLASTDTSSINSGACYTFKRKNSTWSQTAYLKASNADANDYFGFSSVLGNGTAVVGTPFESSNQNTVTNGPGASSDNSVNRAGAVYIFKAR
ncbi:FG-GAP repeat protein [Bdellovibrio sp. HCB2-146]|uniref:FG-GAP repeat protein n=1 Tax=Bdellovibrio sp. HCB2-146 TaxID=3394362 RepID=UPI0039BD2B14